MTKHIEISTFDIINYLQEHNLWADPDGDMDPKELDEFCSSLMDTQEVTVQDISEWVAVNSARDITQETKINLPQFNIPKETVRHHTVKGEDIPEEYLFAEKKSYKNMLKVLKTTVSELDRKMEDVFSSLDETPSDIRMTFHISVGRTALSKLISTVILYCGDYKKISVTSNDESSTIIYFRTRSEIISLLEISVEVGLD